MGFRVFVAAIVAAVLVVPSFAQTPTTNVSDPGAPLSGYPRKALGLPTAAELKTATYVRDVVYGHRDGMALTYDVFKPRKPNGALVVNMVSAGWNSTWGPPRIVRRAISGSSTRALRSSLSIIRLRRASRYRMR